MPTFAHKLTKHLDAAVNAVVDATRQRLLTVTASVEDIDREGDVILIDGISTAHFERNPVVLADHDPHLPIGKVVALWKEQRPIRALMAKVELLPPGISAKADEVWGQIQHGTRRGISVGFLPLDATGPTLRGQKGLTYRSVSLLEISSVSIPSCAACLIVDKSRKESAMKPSCSCDKTIDISYDELNRLLKWYGPKLVGRLSTK
jgi:hypothetical protein